MKTRTELLIDSLTNGSGRNVFTVNETKKLVRISQLENSDNIEELENEILKFKQEYADGVYWLA